MSKSFHDREHVQIIHIILKSGERLKKHITPVDVVFYVLRREGIVEIGDEKSKVGSDTLIYSPAYTPHCWYNESNTEIPSDKDTQTIGTIKTAITLFMLYGI